MKILGRLKVNKMKTLNLNIELQDLHFFDSYLRKEIMGSPVTTLRAQGSYDPNKKEFNRPYEVTIKQDEKSMSFLIELSVIRNKLNPLKISWESKSQEHTFSEKEVKNLLNLLISRIKAAEKKTKEKPMKTFEYEARLLTLVNPIRSTIKFGKYKLVPVETPSKEGWECKLKFNVASIDKKHSITDATVEAKIIAAFLSVIFGKQISLKSFSEITPDPKPIINFEKVDRPDMRPVKHSFGEELKIPQDFQQLWNNFYSLPQKIRESFISSCLCFQVAMDMRMTHIPLSYQLFVTAIEVIAREFIGSDVRPTERFVRFICQNLDTTDKELKKRARKFYGKRSAILHEKGIGLGLIPTFDIRSFETVPMRDLWELEIFVNASLIGFLKSFKPLMHAQHT